MLDFTMPLIGDGPDPAMPDKADRVTYQPYGPWGDAFVADAIMSQYSLTASVGLPASADISFSPIRPWSKIKAPPWAEVLWHLWGRNWLDIGNYA